MRGTTRLAAAIAVAAMAGGTLAACGSDNKGSGQSAAGGGGGDKAKPTIAFVVGNANDAFYQKALEGARDEASKLGVDLLDQGPTQFAPDAQIAVIDALLAKQPDALAIAPVDPTALIAPLRKYANAKIPIVTYDGALANPPFDLVSQISSQNTEGGAMAADAMAKAIGDAGKVAIIDLNTSNKVLTDRKDGFVAKLAADHPKVKVVATQLTGMDFGSAQTITQTLRTKHPDLKGIFATFELASLPAAKAIADAKVADTFTLIGYEAGPKTIDYIKQGVIKAVVAQQPAEEGRLAVRAAYGAATGKTGDVQPEVKLPGVLIDHDNVDSMQKYYYKVGG
jgi:ribose transport system substrate-binding protein